MLFSLFSNQRSFLSLSSVGEAAELCRTGIQSWRCSRKPTRKKKNPTMRPLKTESQRSQNAESKTAVSRYNRTTPHARASLSVDWPHADFFAIARRPPPPGSVDWRFTPEKNSPFQAHFVVNTVIFSSRIWTRLDGFTKAHNIMKVNHSRKLFLCGGVLFSFFFDIRKSVLFYISISKLCTYIQ